MRKLQYIPAKTLEQMLLLDREWTLAEIAKHLGYTESEVREAIRRAKRGEKYIKVRPKRRRTTDEVKVKILAMHRDGETQRYIAETLGRSLGVVSRVIAAHKAKQEADYEAVQRKREGLPPRVEASKIRKNRPITEYEKHAIRIQRQAKFGWDKIAKNLGRSSRTIRQHAKKMGLPTREPSPFDSDLSIEDDPMFVPLDQAEPEQAKSM